MKKCNGKNCYSKKAANDVKHRAMTARQKKLRVYECPFCFFYHLTSMV